MSKIGRIKASDQSTRVVKLIEAARDKRQSTDDKSWSNADLANDLFLAAVTDPTIPDIKAWALDQVRIWDDGLRPNPEQPGLSFYDADAQIPLGKSRRIKMKDVSGPTQLLKWSKIEMSQYAAQTSAFSRKINYISTRQEAWLEHPECKTLDELEKTHFK